MKSFRFIIVLFILMLILLFVYFLKQYLALNKLQESFYGGAIEESGIILDSDILEEPYLDPREPMILGGYQNNVFKATSSTSFKMWKDITYPLNGGGYDILPFDMFGVNLGFLCDDTTEGAIFSVGPSTNKGLPYFAIMIQNKKIILFMCYDLVTSAGKSLRPSTIPSNIQTTEIGIQLNSKLNTINSDYKKIEIQRKKKDGKDFVSFFNLESKADPEIFDITGFYVHDIIDQASLVYCGCNYTQPMAATYVHNLHMTKPNKLLENFTGFSPPFSTSQIEPFSKYIHSGFKIFTSKLNNTKNSRRFPYRKTIDPLFNDGNKARYIKFPPNRVSKMYTTYVNSGTAPESAFIDVMCQGGDCMLEINGLREFFTRDIVKTISITFKPGLNQIILTNEVSSNVEVSVLLSCYTKTTPSNLQTGFTKSWSSETIDQNKSTNDDIYEFVQIKGPTIVLPRGKENKQEKNSKDKILISGFIRPSTSGSYEFNIIGLDVEFYLIDMRKPKTMNRYEQFTGRIEPFSNGKIQVEPFSNGREGFKNPFSKVTSGISSAAKAAAEAAQRAAQQAAETAAAEAARAAAAAVAKAAAEAAQRAAIALKLKQDDDRRRAEQAAAAAKVAAAKLAADLARAAAEKAAAAAKRAADLIAAARTAALAKAAQEERDRKAKLAAEATARYHAAWARYRASLQRRAALAAAWAAEQARRKAEEDRLARIEKQRQIEKAAREAEELAARVLKAAQEEAARVKAAAEKAAAEEAERQRLAAIAAAKLIIDNQRTSEAVTLVGGVLVPYYILWDGHGKDAPVDLNVVSYKKDKSAEEKIPDGMFLASTDNGIILKFVSDPDNKSWFYI